MQRIMKTIKLFELSRNSDQTEGRGHNVPVGYFEALDQVLKTNDDERFFSKYGVMGTKYTSVSGGFLPYNIVLKTFDIYSTSEEFFEKHDKQTKIQKALAKLTEEEKELLGVK
jgi:hypothetical protein